MFPVEAFFRRYEKRPDVPFVYKPKEPAPTNFINLWLAHGFPEHEGERHEDYNFRVMKQAYNKALIDQFNGIYGVEDNIEGWRKLCRATGNTKPPREIAECKAIMKGMHVNLVDLTEWIDSRSSQFVTVFPDVESLSEYTIARNKVFPRDEVEAGDILKFFLCDRDDLPLARFFAQYEDQGFYYRPSCSASDEFERLCKHLGFPNKPAKRKKLPAYVEVRQAYDDALTLQFNEVYGTDMEDYNAWYELCSRIGVYPIPDTIKECRKIMKTKHVNLVDLTQNTPPVRPFETEEELRVYTIRYKKVFPRHNIHSGDILKYLLRKIF